MLYCALLNYAYFMAAEGTGAGIWSDMVGMQRFRYRTAAEMFKGVHKDLGKFRDKLKHIPARIRSLIPQYSLIPLLLALVFNMTVYSGARLIAGGWYHYNIESFLDRMIPFWPPSAAVYLGCYVFWVVNYILIARQEKKEVCSFFAGDFLSRIICLAFFLLFPTTNTRPDVGDTGFWNMVMRLIYRVDAADNLFPSIHCLVSWFCYIGIRNREDISVRYRRFSCIMAILICISTLTTKQHVIPDAAAGIILAEICFRAGKCPSVFLKYEKIIDWINGKLFRSRGEADHADKKKGRF